MYGQEIRSTLSFFPKELIRKGIDQVVPILSFLLSVLKYHCTSYSSLKVKCTDRNQTIMLARDGSVLTIANGLSNMQFYLEIWTNAPRFELSVIFQLLETVK